MKSEHESVVAIVEHTSAFLELWEPFIPVNRRADFMGHLKDLTALWILAGVESVPEGVTGHVSELLARSCDQTGGTQVINCVAHMNRVLTERPTDCHLCSADIQNRLRMAVDVNAWLNEWKNAAEKILRSMVGQSPGPL